MKSADLHILCWLRPPGQSARYRQPPMRLQADPRAKSKKKTTRKWQSSTPVPPPSSTQLQREFKGTPQEGDFSFLKLYKFLKFIFSLYFLYIFKFYFYTEKSFFD